MVERRVQIPNKLGLHARPAQLFAQTASQFESEITVEKDGMVVDGKSIMGLMLLVAEQGAWLTIRAEGPDAKEAVDALAQIVEEGFGEE